MNSNAGLIKTAAVLITTFLLFATAQAEEIKLSGGGGPLDSVIKPVQESFEKSSGIKIKIAFSSATLAFKQLYNSEAEVAAAGSSYDDLIASLKKENFDVKDPTVFKNVTVGKGVIRTIVNKGNPVAKLSKEQLKGIFTGKITNWKDVGGNDSPIIVVLSNINPATLGTFKKVILDGEAYSK